MLKNLRRSLKYSFWNSVDNFWPLLGVNFLWVLVHVIPVYLLVSFTSERTLSEENLGFFRGADFFSFISNYLLASFPFILQFEAEMTEFTKNFHQLTFWGVLFFSSPFSLAVWKLNADLGNRRALNIKKFFTEAYRQIPRSALFIVLGSLFILFCFININFYQKVFNGLPLLVHLFVFSILFLELFFFMCFLQAMPVLMNEDKKMIACFKRSYLFLIHFLPSASVLFLSFWGVLLLTYWQLVPSLSFVLVFFLYPAFWGQFMNEHYLTSAEAFGLARPVEEKRSFKKWLFPQGTSR